MEKQLLGVQPDKLNCSVYPVFIRCLSGPRNPDERTLAEGRGMMCMTDNLIGG